MTNLLHNLIFVTWHLTTSGPGLIFLGIVGIAALYMAIEIAHAETHPGNCLCSWCQDDRRIMR